LVVRVKVKTMPQMAIMKETRTMTLQVQ
jgi:hypothetical protein